MKLTHKTNDSVAVLFSHATYAFAEPMQIQLFHNVDGKHLWLLLTLEIETDKWVVLKLL